MKRLSLALVLFGTFLILLACDLTPMLAPASTATLVPMATPYPTYTPLPTYTLVPTATPVPPTATPVPPTAIPIPPTATSVPTATPIPLTATPRPTSTPLPSPTSDIPAGMGALSSTNFIGGGLDITLTIGGKSYVVPNADKKPNNQIVIYLPPGKYVFSATIPRRSALRCELFNGCTVEIKAGQYTYLDWS